ncbi:cytochrome-c oxidase, cbb3-type subunit III [Teredinibacter waterburyi]|uniref:cytochrome-c oxidase, cbb3-type subunit III n=1 Tax=Teredinibacter waterburyi TaxID=1500538 RepID=UPI00165EEF29|nr:cytochrome-c oxidase, cbb3-type subunit III [Teredinibacter waterburyi]
MSMFWNLWIIGLTVVCTGLVLWVLLANRKVAQSDDDDPENRTTGHVYDGIEEYDNPLPRWWFLMFVGTIIFGVGYLALYPGLGSYKGILGWTSVGELQLDQQEALENYSETFGAYSQMPIDELIHDGRALKMGVRLFADNCAVCHGADGGGNFSFPNLTDKDWLYGGTAEAIKQSITDGRAGQMPAWGSLIGEPSVVSVSEYVLQLSGQPHEKALAVNGAKVFTQNCAACHGADATGNHLIGAPNLTDTTWLYDGSRAGIQHSVRMGLANEMPAQHDKLREEKIHILAAYVYSLSFDYED